MRNILDFKIGFWLLVLLLAAAGCATGQPNAGIADDGHDHVHDEGEEEAEDLHEIEMLFWPELEAVALNGDRLRVVATTSIIGDVVVQVGGDAIELTTLMGPGQDPHGYEPSARALTAVADAHVIFINGWGLEEGLIANLEQIAGETPLVPVSSRIAPLASEDDHAAEGEASHLTTDPHTWLDPHNVVQWVTNIKIVLSDLDPARAAVYDANADAYRLELEDLIAYFDQQVATIPADGRKLVTNHDSLGYFAQAYGFKIVGTVIPASSTLAEPSANALVDLVSVMAAEGVCQIFTETTANDSLAQAVAAEIAGCPDVKIIPLFTGSIGPGGGYIEMMRANVDAIAAGLR